MMINNLIRIAIVCILLFILSIALASAETVVMVTVAECSICHSDVAFDAATVNRSLTCVNCHFGYHTKGTLTEFGYYKSNESANVTAPYVHIKHVEQVSITTPCLNCHMNIDCVDCHIPDSVFHISHGSNNTDPIYSCESELCHNEIVTQISRHGVPVYIWNITQSPACENCHARHNITASHQSDLTPDCQTCHSNYLPDTHAEIANLSYEGDSCSVCHQSTNETVVSAIANDNTSCIACHALHGDITEIHTSTSMCIDCHQPYLPELHDDYAVEYGITNCSVCHNNANITIAIASADCTTCHGTQLPQPHLDANHTSVAECTICHDPDLPAVHFDNCTVCHINPAINMTLATNDCNSCHVDQDVGYHSGMDISHTSSTAECIICHETDLPVVHRDNCTACHANPAINMTLATSDCNSCHVDQDVGYHSNFGAKHTSTSNCIDCHKDPYLPTLHDDYALANNITNCTVCHNNIDIDISKATAECTTCHGTQLPQQHENEVEKHTTPACAICHGTYGESYLPTTHNATVDNGRCDLCHNNPLIDMSISTSNCSTCHGPQIAQAHYNASVKHTFEFPVQCADCHDMYIPQAHIDQYGNVNCFICHKNNPDITYLPTDRNCTSCHGTQIPEPHLDVNHTSTSECTSCHEEDLSAVHLDNCTVCHRNPAIDMGRATTDCNSCHVDQDIGFHVHEVAKHTSPSCTLCHDAYLPATHDATIGNGRCDLCHANPAIDMSISTSDCTSCHGTQMDPPHYNVSVKHAFESPAECARCHDLNLAATHSDQYGSVMCFACHDNPKILDLPTDKDCLSCHGPDGPYPSHKSRGKKR